MAKTTPISSLENAPKYMEKTLFLRVFTRKFYKHANTLAQLRNQTVEQQSVPEVNSMFYPSVKIM